MKGGILLVETPLGMISEKRKFSMSKQLENPLMQKCKNAKKNLQDQVKTITKFKKQEVLGSYFCLKIILSLAPQ